MTINAVRVSAGSFERYGKTMRLQSLEEFADHEQGWRCWITEDFCMNQTARVGMGFAKQSPPYRVESMKRHFNTKKLFACGDGPVVIAVADTDADAPNADDVRAFILEPGEYIVVDEGIWYDACHGIDGPASFFFLSLEADEQYIPVADGAVTVELGS